MKKNLLLIFSFTFLLSLLFPFFTASAETACITSTGQSGIISSVSGNCVPTLTIQNPLPASNGDPTSQATTNTGADTSAANMDQVNANAAANTPASALTSGNGTSTGTNTGAGAGGAGTGTGTTGGLVPCGHGNNPANACTLCSFIVGFHNLVQFGLGLLITLTVVGIFFSGAMYIISSGNEQLITKAKTFLSASLVGFSLVLAAWLLVNVVMWAISYNTSVIQQTNWWTFSCTSTGTSATPSTATPNTPAATTLTKP